MPIQYDNTNLINGRINKQRMKTFEQYQKDKGFQEWLGNSRFDEPELVTSPEVEKHIVNKCNKLYLQYN